MKLHLISGDYYPSRKQRAVRISNASRDCHLDWMHSYDLGTGSLCPIYSHGKGQSMVDAKDSAFDGLLWICTCDQLSPDRLDRTWFGEFGLQLERTRII